MVVYKETIVSRPSSGRSTDTAVEKRETVLFSRGRFKIQSGTKARKGHSEPELLTHNR